MVPSCSTQTVVLQIRLITRHWSYSMVPLSIAVSCPYLFIEFPNIKYRLPDTFQKLLPLGAASNIRLVVVNRRDYAGSTKYTDGNLKELNAGEESFMKRLGLEVAHLLLWFADTQKVPKINADRKSGGFAVMGWSIGSATPLAVLAYPEVIGKETYQKLEPYFRKLIFFGPLYWWYCLDWYLTSISRRSSIPDLWVRSAAGRLQPVHSVY